VAVSRSVTPLPHHARIPLRSLFSVVVANRSSQQVVRARADTISADRSAPHCSWTSSTLLRSSTADSCTTQWADSARLSSRPRRLFSVSRLSHGTTSFLFERLAEEALMDAVASDDSSYINGTDFLVDGGLHACYVVSVSPLPDPGSGLTLRRRPRVTRCFPLRRVLCRTSASSPRVLEWRGGT
jgi:hypothetical protein